MCLAWFDIPSGESISKFKDLVLSNGALYEGSGTDLHNGHIEGFVVFSSRKSMESFAKRALKMDFELVGSVD
jgi:hypothetical protein